MVESLDVKGEVGWWSKMIAHPHNEMVLVSTKRDVLFVNVHPFNILTAHNVIYGKGKKYNNIRDICISADGVKCVVTTYLTGVFLLDISSTDKITTIGTYKSMLSRRSYMWSSHLHKNTTTVVSAGRDGLVIWDSNTSRIINKVSGDYLTFHTESQEKCSTLNCEIPSVDLPKLSKLLRN